MQDQSQEKATPAGPEAPLSRCLVEGSTTTRSRDRRRRRTALGASFIIETLVLTLLVVSPLLTSVAHPQLPILPPMPIVLGAWHSHQTNQQTLHKPLPSAMRIGDMIPQTVFPGPVVKNLSDADRDIGPILEPPGEIIPGAIQITDFDNARSMVEPPHIDLPKAHQMAIVKLSEGVQQAQLILRVEPRYPPLALQIKKEGVVLLRAIINREGRITSLEVLGGHPLLVQAALDAVRQWRYRPTMLNGEPVEVETSITVIFRLTR